MIIIRDSTVEDALSIQKLLRETWADTYGGYLSQATLDEVYKNWQNVDVLSKQIQDPNVYFPVATDKNEVVGIATAQNSDGTTILFRLYVDPAHQRQGIGEKLLGSVIQRYSENSSIQLHVEVMNQKGQAFYKKHGFNELKREEEKVVNEMIEQILMEKEIA